MKKIFVINAAILLLAVVAAGCNNQQQNNMNKDQPQFFNSPAEAVKKAKADLLGILQSNKEFATGIDVATLEKAQPGEAIKQIETDFNKLLNADSTGSMDKLQASELNTVIPLLADNKILTVAELSKSNEGWKVAGLADKSMTDDLNAVKAAAGDSATITIYHLPNLQTNVYAVKKGDSELLYVNYGDKYSLRQGVRASELLPFLKAEAIDFQKRYGDEIKKQKLVR
jgi:hypothetical protein